MGVTKKGIVRGLRELGLPEGSIVMVHSSLSAFSYVVGGADAVIDAILETIGPGGTMMVPTYTSRREQVFDLATTPSVMGIIPETSRQRPGALRSRHPYHPVAAIGPRAAEMLADHEQASGSCGEGTPLARLIEAGGYVLLLGVDQDTNTLLHTVEAELDMPYLRRLEMPYLDEQGQVQCAVPPCAVVASMVLSVWFQPRQVAPRDCGERPRPFENASQPVAGGNNTQE